MLDDHFDGSTEDPVDLMKLFDGSRNAGHRMHDETPDDMEE